MWPPRAKRLRAIKVECERLNHLQCKAKEGKKRRQERERAEPYMRPDRSRGGGNEPSPLRGDARDLGICTRTVPIVIAD
jgi:hypothetical protein